MRTVRLSDWRLWVISFSAWTAFSFLYGASNYAWRAVAGHPLPLSSLEFLHLLNCWIDAFLTPFVFVTSAKFVFRKSNWLRFVGIHAAGMVIFTATHMVIRMVLYPVHNFFTGELEHSSFSLVWRMFWFGLHSEGVTAYLSVVGVAQLVRSRSEVQQRALAAEQMRRMAAETRIEMLRLQLQPHFLFNCLNTAAEMIHAEPESAERMLISIADLLREIIDGMRSNTHTLAEELEFTKTYFSIQQMRFPARLLLNVDVPEVLYRCLVPAMLLQPLVENSVKHGMSQGSKGLVVTINARDGNDQLDLWIRDNGRGLLAHPNEGGTGLRNTRERLNHLYPGANMLTILPAQGGGTVVHILIPRRELQQDPIVNPANEMEPIADDVL